MQKQLKVTINGKQYSISTDEHDQDVLQAAQRVDTLIRDTTDKMPTIGADKIALMVALHLAIDLAKSQRLVELDEHRLENVVRLVTDIV